MSLTKRACSRNLRPPQVERARARARGSGPKIVSGIGVLRANKNSLVDGTDGKRAAAQNRSLIFTSSREYHGIRPNDSTRFEPEVTGNPRWVFISGSRLMINDVVSLLSSPAFSARDYSISVALALELLIYTRPCSKEKIEREEKHEGKRIR